MITDEEQGRPGQVERPVQPAGALDHRLGRRRHVVEGAVGLRRRGDDLPHRRDQRIRLTVISAGQLIKVEPLTVGGVCAGMEAQPIAVGDKIITEPLQQLFDDPPRQRGLLDQLGQGLAA
jgi:hypothetical protein